MPAYTTNILEISSKNHNNDEILNFLEKHLDKDDCFDFNTLIPEPDNIDDCPNKYNLNINSTRIHNKKTLHNPLFSDDDGKDWFNWYEWRCDNWNTKWNACGPQFLDYKKIKERDVYSELHLLFYTAWNVPEPVVIELFRMHPELDITWEYHDDGKGVYGSYFKLFKDDELYHTYHKLNPADEEIIQL